MYGIGIDICEVKRFDRLKQDERFLQRIFSENEILYCSKLKRSSEAFAVRFAAKEAFSKAIGTGIAKGVSLSEIEIKKEESGKPYISLTGNTLDLFNKLGDKKIHLSLSHEKTSAVAVVVII